MTGEASPLVLNGIDVVSVPRIAQLRAEFGESFLQRSFTARERTYCERRGTPAQHYAARWAAKEAFLKTLGGEADGVPTSAVGIVHEGKRPRLSLDGPAADALDDVLRDRGYDRESASRSVSLSHDSESGVAIASVTIVATSEDGREQYD